MSLSQLSSRVWQYGKVIAESVPLETLNEELSDTRTLSWYDLTAPDREDIDILADELNIVMKKLAGWAAIIAVPTFVTGWFGQNVPFLGDGRPLGLWISAVLVVASSVLLYLVFRREDWI